MSNKPDGIVWSKGGCDPTLSTFNGVTRNITQWENYLGYGVNTLRSRIRKFPLEQAMNKNFEPPRGKNAAKLNPVPKPEKPKAMPRLPWWHVPPVCSLLPESDMGWGESWNKTVFKI